MNKKHKIVALQTEDITQVMLPVKENEASHYHLYILSDDEIKEGDWYMFNNVLGQANSRHGELGRIDQHKKIIATTNPKLMIPKEYDEYSGNVKIPQIPQSLVEYYAKYQPEEIVLEYEEKFFTEEDGFNNTKSVRLKLQDNEVVWVENKFQGMKDIIDKHKKYTREEVEKLCRAAYELGELEGYSEGLEGADIEQWLKDNL